MYGPGRKWAHDSIGATAPAVTWYLAEGSTAGGMETWVLVQNPCSNPVSVDITLMTESGPLNPPELQDVLLAGHYSAVFAIRAYVTTHNVSTMEVAEGGEVVCERAMYGPGREWAHDSIGATALDDTWYLAEGSTYGGMETWVLVQNPNPDAVTLDITLMTESGPLNPPELQDVLLALSETGLELTSDDMIQIVKMLSDKGALHGKLEYR